MATINKLTSIDALAAGDTLPVYDASNGDARKASLSTLVTYLNSALTFSTARTQIKQLATPNATGFSVSCTDTSNDIWLVLTQGATYATGTIVLPPVNSCIDMQEIHVFTKEIVTALTVDGNGASLIAAPTSAGANGSFLLKFNSANSTWYRMQ